MDSDIKSKRVNTKEILKRLEQLDLDEKGMKIDFERKKKLLSRPVFVRNR